MVLEHSSKGQTLFDKLEPGYIPTLNYLSHPLSRSLSSSLSLSQMLAKCKMYVPIPLALSKIVSVSALLLSDCKLFARNILGLMTASFF
eukprot:1283683-Amorphochlora_amoeboformis.AAC.1